MAEERQLAADYDRAVKAEMQTGQVETSIDPKSGKEIVRFTGTSYETIAKLYDDFSQKIQTLNQQYLALYIAEVQPTPFPTRSTEKDNEDYYQELLAQYPAFFDQLLKDGPTVMVYDPNDGMVYQRVIGDTHAKSEIMTGAIETLHQAPQMAKVDQEANITQIRKTLGNPDLQLTFRGIARTCQRSLGAGGYLHGRSGCDVLGGHRCRPPGGHRPVAGGKSRRARS